ncbi:unnamed protein product [Moneuplotes crassus]|uniref:RING-type domain-containing protein n=1 Tax=Euplotes crassus TaxID=5936 RepID=A0AAD1XLJ9_EUPCR|nr:unnamed protein product [Moneuplotes crassus]
MEEPLESNPVVGQEAPIPTQEETTLRRRRRMTQATAPDLINRNVEYLEGGILRTINSILPLPVDEVGEREVYSRFTSKELASYMINLLKERIIILRLILTIFVIAFTNLTNVIFFFPNKKSNWDQLLKTMIYLTPVWQLIWFILLVMGKNYSKWYISIKLICISLICMTSVVAYLGVNVQPSLFQACDSRLTFIVCMINILSILLCSFFVLFSIVLIIIASIISLIFALAFLPFMLIYLLSYNTCKEGFSQIYKIYNLNRMRSLYQSQRYNRSLLAHEDENTNSCTICFLEFREKIDYVLDFDCKHVFHQHCVEKWLNMNKNSCPLCRHKIF